MGVTQTIFSQDQGHQPDGQADLHVGNGREDNASGDPGRVEDELTVNDDMVDDGYYNGTVDKVNPEGVSQAVQFIEWVFKHWVVVSQDFVRGIPDCA
jgi:hypothetical protein